MAIKKLHYKYYNNLYFFQGGKPPSSFRIQIQAIVEKLGNYAGIVRNCRKFWGNVVEICLNKQLMHMRSDRTMLASAYCNKSTRVFTSEMNKALINATFARYIF